MFAYASESDRLISWMNINAAMQDDVRRRAAFLRRHQLLAGDFRDLVKQRVREVFANEEVASRCAILADSSCNVFQFVTTEIAQYQGARRAFANGVERDPVYQRLDEKIEPFDLVMQECLAALFACNDALIRVLPGIPGVRDGRPSVRVFRPHECMVIPREDDPSQPEVVSYEKRTRSGEIVTVVWTEDEHYVLGSKGDVRYVDGANGIKNPLGRLPFVAIHAGLRPDAFWDEETGADRAEFAIDYLAGWSAVRHLIHQQSHKQIAVSGVDEDWTPPAHVGPGTIWRFSQGVEVDVLDVQANPNLLVDALERSLAGHMATQGLNPQSLGQNPGQAPPSGLALFLDRQKVIERRRKLHPALVEAEYALAELYRWAHNATPGQTETIDEGAEFEVEILEETVVQSPLEMAQTRNAQLDVYKKERELGLRSIVEQISQDRGISLEEAAALLPSLQPPTPTPTPAPPAPPPTE